MVAAGVVYPIRLVIQLPEGESALSARRLAGLKVLTDSLARSPRVKEVRGVASIRRGMSTLQLAIYYSDAPAVRAKNPKFFNAYLSADNRITLIDVIPGDTVSLTGMMDIARRARAIARRGTRGLAGAEVLVGGFAAGSLDSQLELLRRLPITVGFILGITAIMLFFAFRSLLVPLKAVLLNCLSVSAAFGLTVLVFQHGYGGRLFGLEGPTEAIWGVAPVLVFATVFGLSMDYEVFLLTRVKEVFDKTGRNDHATMEGLSATASTITSAALIMILVFGTFAFARVLAVQLIGFGLAAAVLLDATLIRMVLVPAIMHIAGRWNWWPGVRAPRMERGDGGCGLIDDKRDAGRRREVVHLRQADRVVRAVVEEGFLGRREVPQIRLHGADVRLLLRVGELRDRNSREDPDDHHHDEELDQGKATSRQHRSPSRALKGAEPWER